MSLHQIQKVAFLFRLNLKRRNRILTWQLCCVALSGTVPKSKEKKKPKQLKLNFVNQCCGSGMFIPDTRSEFFPSGIRNKEFKYLNPKEWFPGSQKYGPGCSSRIQILFFNPSWIPDSGSRGQEGNKFRILICNTEIYSPTIPWTVNLLLKIF